jgi:transcriptional regulator with XRE-family HTH domain
MPATLTPTSAPWIPQTDSLAARFALIRREMGWNLTEAATECHLQAGAWSRIEQGMRPRDLLETVERVVARTGVSRFWLLTGEKEPQSRTANPMSATSADQIVWDEPSPTWHALVAA